MSRFYVSTNQENAKLLFNKRAYYNSSVSSGNGSLTRFIAEKFLYGRVDRDFSPMHIKDPDSYLKQFSKVPADRVNLRALEFVVDAFNDMAQQFDKCLQLGQIDANDPYLSRLKVYRAYESPRKRYKSYLDTLNANIRRNANRKGYQIRDFESFVDFLMESTENSPVATPCTMPAYIKNRRTPPTISGLVVEIANFNKSIDDIKIAGFVNSKNWEFFLNVAKTYGFMVDRNVPWRLVADIGSSAMLSYAARYGANSTDSVISKYYDSTGFIYLTQFPRRMYEMYNACKPRYIEVLEDCGDRIESIIEVPKDYETLENFKNVIGQEQLNEIYCHLRFLEEQKDTVFTDVQKRKMVDDFSVLYKNVGKAAAARQFEFIINKPFDYTGSMSYNINAQRLSDEIEESENTVTTTAGTLSGVTATTGY